jgi:hypothetical protein
MNPSDNLIRITNDDANSSEVDDFLKRQMSLRGEPGVTRDHGRKWYYQSWFVFMLVGAIGAIAAWAILEPFFDDMPYIQGAITDLQLEEGLPLKITRGGRTRELRRSVAGSLTLNGEKIYILHGAREIRADGTKHRLDLGSLKEGQTVGVYSQYFDSGDEEVAIGHFVDLAPKPQSPARAKLTLRRLHSRTTAAGMLLFPLVAGFIGLFVGAADGLICRLPRRAILCGVVGLLVGIVGGFVCSIAADIAYAPLSQLATSVEDEASSGLSTFGFIIQMFGRSLAWCLAGIAMGLGQGIALRSKRLLIYGLLGGVVGGLLGGLLFDPIDLILLGPDKPSAHISRLIGFGVIGASVGAMIGIVEILARDAWLRMSQGPLTGKEFLLFKDVMKVGSSPRSDIYLFNDQLVAPDHAIIRAVGDECEIEVNQRTHPVLVNNSTIRRSRLRHGDNVTIGRTVFVFQRRKG